MKKLIVDEAGPVTLVGGGHLEEGDLNEALSLAPTLVAADGGAAAALARGHVPCAVIGDFDSLPAETQTRLPRDVLHHVAEQNSTDFDKALRSIRAPVVLGAGFLGARVDHQLAAFHTLIQPGRSPCILIGANELVFHLRRRISLPMQAGDVVSLFPMQPVTGRSGGLVWPIDGLDLCPTSRIGTSNRAEGEIWVEADGPGLLGIVPRRYLPALMRAIAE
ncbi:thiamine diphosphokinase [Phycobacter sp. K97]|jgi:thiamine pyrophosphokinase|uniref:thiamine diphosphokinase n=1 Tax=Phycobacter sedimenti TaxID=3133977 RepID=UPI00311D351F